MAGKQKAVTVAVGLMLCECDEDNEIKRCKTKGGPMYYTSCAGCRSRRFLSPALYAALDKQKLIFSR